MDEYRTIDLYQDILPISSGREEQNVFHLKHESGAGTVTLYQVFPGIELAYNDIHMLHSPQGMQPSPDVIEINHCREGRYECAFDDHTFCYVEKGDLTVSRLSNVKTASHFPTGHYHGVSILLHCHLLGDQVQQILEDLTIDIGAISSLLSTQPALVKRASPSIEHIFSELYSVGDPHRMGYLKIKVLELLLFLCGLQDEQGEERVVYAAHHVRAVKAVRDYITEDPARQFTLDELSDRFGIARTAMAKTFKGVYGNSIYAYYRSWRLRLAAELLRETEHSVTAISETIGYEHSGKFSTAFEAEFGLAPLKYRQKVRLEQK